MHRRKTALVCGIVFVVALACSQGWGAVTFLRTQGQDMVDEGGKKVLLRGVGPGQLAAAGGVYVEVRGPGGSARKIEKIVSDLIGQEEADRFWSEFRKSYITEADIEDRGAGFQLRASCTQCPPVPDRGGQPCLCR